MVRLPPFEDVLPVLTRPLRHLPHSLQREALQAALRQAFRAGTQADDLEFLAGRCLAIEIEDVGWRWPITLAAGRLCVLERNHAADATIRGQTAAFLAMAGRLEDPDTLFFQRRLVIEGDTELGLWLKNFLDGVDEQGFPLPLRLALKGLREAQLRLSPN